MKEVIVFSNAGWNGVDDKLTDAGREKCVHQSRSLDPFAIVISSPSARAQETAELLSGQKPKIDERANGQKPSFESDAKASKSRKMPFGIFGAKRHAEDPGDVLKGLLMELLKKLNDDQRALVVTHPDTMSALEKVLAISPIDRVDGTYGEMDGLGFYWLTER